jgi:hypothetical protein
VRAEFLADDGVIRPGTGQPCQEHLLDALVDFGHRRAVGLRTHGE